MRSPLPQQELPACFYCCPQALTMNSEITAEEWAVPSAQGLPPVIAPAKFTLVEDCIDFLLEEFDLIYFLWNVYKVATLRSIEKENFLSNYVVRKSTEICLRLTTFFHVSSLSLVVAYVALLLSPTGLRKDTKRDSCLL